MAGLLEHDQLTVLGHVVEVEPGLAEPQLGGLEIGTLAHDRGHDLGGRVRLGEDLLKGL